MVRGLLNGLSSQSRLGAVTGLSKPEAEYSEKKAEQADVICREEQPLVKRDESEESLAKHRRSVLLAKDILGAYDLR